ncbi:hypothetical protein M434DRAFT_29397 [Hypoxylon sp. CO27-5]|nr:hypothetical protein M434DRAFT_29397 [Hypoxylon sp. CO27-5]
MTSVQYKEQHVSHPDGVVESSVEYRKQSVSVPITQASTASPTTVCLSTLGVRVEFTPDLQHISAGGSEMSFKQSKDFVSKRKSGARELRLNTLHLIHSITNGT